MTFQICVTLQWYISKNRFNSCWDKVLFDNNFLNGIFCCPQTNNECIEKAGACVPDGPRAPSIDDSPFETNVMAFV